MSWFGSFALVCLALLAHRVADAGPLFTDTFEAYGAGQCLDLEWQVVSGAWEVGDGRLVGRSTERAVCFTSASPATVDQRIDLLVTPGRRLASAGWAAAGVALWAGSGNFWRLSLVEGPEGRRYAELVEMRNAVWQAQNEGATKLEQLPDGVDAAQWQTDHTYRLRLTVSPGGIAGDVTDDETGDTLFRRGFVLPPGVDAVRAGRPGLLIDALEARFDDLRVTGSVVRPAGQAPPSGARLGLLDTGLPDASPDLIAALQDAFAQAGLDCARVPGDHLVADGVPPEVGLLVLPHTRRLPLGALPALDRFLRTGGKAIFLGGPLGEEAVVRRDDRWLSVPEALAETPTAQLLVDFGKQDPASWTRAAAAPDTPAVRTLDPAGPPGGGQALRVQLDRFRGWDTVSRTFSASPFPAGHALTCFWAKGGPKTSHLVVEWDERDGSRWMAGVPLTTAWRRHVLASEDFKYWPDNPSVGRGGPGDRLRPENASALAVGLATSHSPITEGAHAYWIADLGSAPAPFPLDAAPPLLLEAVSPPYKTFLPGGAVRLASAPGQAVAGDIALPAPPGLRCALPRTRGLGLRKARLGRWIPLLVAGDRAGHSRGVAASIYLSFADPYDGAAWGVIGTEDADYLRRHLDQLSPLLVGMARRLLTGVWLVKGGSDQFSYFPDETPLVGAQVANLSEAPQELRLAVTVTPKGRPVALFDRSWPISALPGVMTGASAEWRGPAEPGTYLVRSELRRGEELLDTSYHECLRLPEPSAREADFVSVRDGDFWLGGKRWHPHGINFWPSNATALEAFAYGLHWLDPTSYDPEVLRGDVEALHDLRLNSVSIAIGGAEQLPALNHFLHLCSERGIKTNLHLGGAYPTGFDVDRPLDLLRRGRLAGNPALWAWDIAWEPHLGDHKVRQALDPRWATWIADRYGSVANAEKDWGMPAPRDEDGAITGPSQEQILDDGSHRVMVAAYRRFVDDLIGRMYGDWARRVHEADPRHLIGVRSGYGGTGQPWPDAVMAYDLISGAKHLDFISPEGYGLGGSWEVFERGGFTTAYGRYAGAGKPVFWAEFGLTIYPGYTPELREAQRALYANMYRMALWSGARGTAGWWFPGGFRVGESSDYGIMNPDGTPRLSALEARKWSPRFAEQGDLPAVDHWITIDRDLHPRGYSQVWARHGDEYVKARRAGRFVGLKTEGTGTDSTTAPLVAVGNVAANGTNPPKFLNAETNSLRLRAQGRWMEVAQGATVDLPAGARVEAAVSWGNTGEAAWLSPARAGTRPGGVFLVSAPDSGLSIREPLVSDVPRFGDVTIGPLVLTESLTGEVQVALRLVAEGRTPFGEKLRFTLRAKE